MLTRYFGDFSTASTNCVRLSGATLSPSQTTCWVFTVPLDEPAELRLGQEAELRGRQSFRRRRARLIVDHAVLAETASRAQAVEADATGPMGAAARSLRQEDLHLALEDHVEAVGRAAL